MEYDEISDDDLDELIENADADEEQELGKPGKELPCKLLLCVLYWKFKCLC